MGLGEVIGALLVDIVKGAGKAIVAGARKALPTTKTTTAKVRSDSAAAYDELSRAVKEREGK